MTVIKGLLFDKDGTLFDFAHTWESWAEAFLLRSCEGDRLRAGRVGADIGFDLDTRKFRRDSVAIAGTPLQITQTLLPHFPDMTETALGDMLEEEAEKAPQIEAVPLLPLLTELGAAGIKLGVATNDTERPTQAHLTSVGIRGFFDFVAGSDSGFGGKPQPGQMFAFAKAVALDPAQIAMVGDSTHDLRAGRAAGMSTVAVLTGLAEHSELAPHADVVLPDIGHLPKWLASLSDVAETSNV